MKCFTANNNINTTHSNCVMCGNQNPLGLKLIFNLGRNGKVIGSFKPNDILEGYPGILHGGVTAALLDSAMTNCLFAHNITALTYELNIRYLKQISTKKKQYLRHILQW